MAEELKKYKVLKQLGWNKGVYSEGDTVEMEPRFAEYYISEKVLEESDTDETLQLAEQPELASTRNQTVGILPPENSAPTTSTSTTPTTEPEAS